MEKCNNGDTALHAAYGNKASIEVIPKLIEVRGRERLMEECSNGRSELHASCANKVSIEVISKLIEIGGESLSWRDVFLV